MSYNVALQCGCSVYVAVHPATGLAHRRVIEQRDPACRIRKHEVGTKLYLWELLPDPEHRPTPLFLMDPADLDAAVEAASGR